MSPFKLALSWLRSALDIDADLAIDDGAVVVEVTLKLNGTVLYTDRFEWTLPSAEGSQPRRLSGLRARRRRLMPEGA